MVLYDYVEEVAMACAINHAGEIPQEISELPESQAGFWRHRCAGCAYMLGRQHAFPKEENLRRRVNELETRLIEMGDRP